MNITCNAFHGLRWNETMLQRQTVAAITWILIAFLVGILFSGCARWNTDLRLPWQDKDDVVEAPQKVVSFWTDTVMHQQGKRGIRGFGGRVFFYGEDDTKPIEADGTLVVYAFDADRNDPSSQRPEKKFVFTADQLADHFSKSELGPSYSVWLPWDEVLGPTRNISLVSRFEGRDGGVVIGEPTNALLPGTSPSKSDDDSADERFGAVQHVNYERQAASAERADARQDRKPLDINDTSSHSIVTESIDLPPSFVRRLQQRAAADSAETNTNDAMSTQGSAEPASSGQGDSRSSTLPPTRAADAPPLTNQPTGEAEGRSR